MKTGSDTPKNQQDSAGAAANPRPRPRWTGDASTPEGERRTEDCVVCAPRMSAGLLSCFHERLGPPDRWTPGSPER